MNVDDILAESDSDDDHDQDHNTSHVNSSANRSTNLEEILAETDSEHEDDAGAKADEDDYEHQEKTVHDDKDEGLPKLVPKQQEEEFDKQNQEKDFAATTETSDPVSVPTGKDKDRSRELKSYTTVGNREITAPLHIIRAKYREREKPSTVPKGKSENDAGFQDVQFAQVVGLDVLETISSQLALNAEFEQHGPGLPTAITVHNKFIVVGTSRSLIIVFDHFQQICKVFCKGKAFDNLDPALRHALVSELNMGSVSALDMVVSGSTSNELLVVGYSKGRVEIWDVVRSTLLRTIQEGPSTHSCAVSCVRFVGTGGTKSSRFDAPSSKKPFATVVSTDTSGVVNMILLNKTLMLLTVELKCLLDKGAGQIVAMAAVEELNLVAISSRRDTFLVSLDNNNAQIVHRWTIEGSSADTPVLPRLSWGMARLADDIMSSSKAHFCLARGRGSSIEFLKAEVTKASGGKNNHKFTLSKERYIDSHSKDSPIIALEWLNDSLLAFLNSDYDLCILDVAGMAVVERTSVKNVELVWTAFNTDTFSFQNSVRASGSSLYLLGIRQLSIAKVQTWSQRVETLIVHNGWLEALALALDHYQLTFHRERNKMSDLIVRFVTNQKQMDLNICAACIEFCVEIERTDLLFDTIYDIFRQYGFGGTFLTLLEPYILNRLLTTIRPSVLQDFVHEYAAQGKLAELEQCILHLNADTIRTDLHTLVSVCKEHNLISGIIYLYTAGLNDYETPVTILLEMGNQLAVLFAYVDTSFRGLTYPFGFPMEDEIAVDFVRAGLLNVLLENLKALAKQMLADANDISELVGLLELGLGQRQDEWELRVVEAIKSLDPSEATSLCARRLALHPIPTLSDKTLVDNVLQRVIDDQQEQMLVSILKNCDPDLYSVDVLSEQIQAYGWSDALTTLHENALQAAIKDGQDLARIQTVYEQIIKVTPKPARFVQQQLRQHEKLIIVREALQNAVLANLGCLLSDESEKDTAAKVIVGVVKDPSALDDFPELQFLHMKRTFIYDITTTTTASGTMDDKQMYNNKHGNDSYITKFIELLCQFEPGDVYRFVSENDGLYPLDPVLQICQKYNRRKATAYLLERTGDSRGALEMILELFDETKSFEARRDINSSAVELCKRNSLIDLDTNASELWFILLDKVSQHAETNRQDEGGNSVILRHVLDSMMAYIESETILNRMNSQNFGQLRHTVKCMIDARTYEKQILHVAKKLASHDLVDLVQRKHGVLGRGVIQASNFNSNVHVVAKTRRKKVAQFQDHSSHHTTKPIMKSWYEQMDHLLPNPLQLDP